MKFSNGTWDVKEGIDWRPAVEVSKLTVTPESLRALTTTRHIRHRGDTLNKPTITVTLTSPLEGVVELTATHFLGKPAHKESRFERFPDFDGKAPESLKPIIQTGHDENAGQASLTAGSLSAEIDTKADAFNVDFKSNGKKLTDIGWNSIAYVTDALHTGRSMEAAWATTTNVEAYARPPLWPTGHRQPYMVLGFGLVPGETFYGLGERFGPFVKNGQMIDMWHEDGGTDSSIAYKNVPFYMSSEGYGVFVDHSDAVSFEVQSERMNKVQISVPGETIRVLVINGPSPKAILERYTAILGRPAAPAPWTYGLWLTTSFLTSYDEKTVTTFVDGMAERGIPLSVFHFDCFWMKGHQWCDFEFDKEYFPDPEGFIGRLKQKGLKICVWINSWIAQESVLFAEGDEKGYFIKRLDGSTWQTDRWQAGMAIVDFTNPEATQWYQSHLIRLMRMGVDAFKTDFAERIPFEGVKYFDGSDPRIAHNFYTFLYNKAVYEAMVQERGPKEACLFARSATAGGQRFPVHWGGDCATLWTGMAESLRGGLSLGLSGFGFHATDIGGFKTPGDRPIPPDPVLYKRWIQWGLLASHSRLHGSTQYRVPWEIEPDSPESSEVLKQSVLLKHRLMPYTLAAGAEAHEKGVPVLRPMFLEFPEDPTTWGLDRQYMFGPNLLVAPIFSAEGKVTYYVPHGRWVGLVDRKERRGPAWFTETHDFSSLPLLVRPGFVVVMGVEDQVPTYDFRDDFEVVVNGAGDAPVPAVDAGTGAGDIVKVEWNGSRVLVDGKEARNVKVTLL
ncbi:sugar hydrolase [Punctularia strigosozonata HHB-11173 SS5]|uniref:sugar hydrolase n=1 Tax=Punctularia strigosozonata (strain HHB-11173) TaxID=741275 RepID=UPI000441664F|nr:sugar hydrolase [Punctularia strigosozonata HHB-11173 SS5]EIN12487.1 sugar hydrolase [Punctularia strigosozonata HHB-11173 SS5]